MSSPLIGQLQPVPPYDFARTLDIVRRYAHPSVDHVRGDAYVRALRVGSALALVRVQAEASGTLNIYLLTSTAPVDDAVLLNQVAHILGTTLDLQAFYTLARKHKNRALWKVIKPVVGVRMLRSPSVFEALMTTIIEQQIAWVSAQRAQKWLVEWGGEGIAAKGDTDETFYAFPASKRIAAATVNDLKPLKITFRRMGLMIDIAEQVEVGLLNLEGLASASPQAAYDVLVALNGIGHWTATYTLTRSLGPLHPYTGTNDVALQAAVNHYFYGGEGRIPPEQVAETFAPFGEFAGIAALHTVYRWIVDRYKIV